MAEGLAYGKLCIASNAPSIVEIAGDLLDDHAPDDAEECLRLVERAIFDPQHRRAKEAELRARYRPSSWTACAEAILASCRAAAEITAAAPVQPAAIPTRRLSL